MVQPPDVVEKYAPDAIFGVLGSGKPKEAKGAAKSALPGARTWPAQKAWKA